MKKDPLKVVVVGFLRLKKVAVVGFLRGKKDPLKVAVVGFLREKKEGSTGNEFVFRIHWE